MDGTEGQKDTLPQGQSPTEDAQGTSQEPKKARTYSESDIQKAVNDALAAKGRDAKTLSDKEANLTALQKQVEASQAQIAEWQRQRDEEELAQARRDPTKMIEYQQKQNYRQLLADLDKGKAELRRGQDELNRSKAQHEADLQAARDTQMEIKVWEIAAKYGLDAAMLKDLNLPTVEQVETVAKRLGTLKRPAEQPKEEFAPDSGVTIGGTGTPTPEQLEKMSMGEYEAWRKKQK